MMNTLYFERIINGETIRMELHCMKTWNEHHIRVHEECGWTYVGKKG